MAKYLLPVGLAIGTGFLGGLLTAGAFSTTAFAIGMTLAPALVGPFPDAPQNQPLDGLRVPSVEFGGAVPRFYGKVRTAGTWIDAPDDGAVVIEKSTKRVRVGLFKKQSVDEFAYFLTGGYALGEGRLVVEKLWANDVVIYDRAGASDAERGYTFTNQTVGGEVVAEINDVLRFYRGTRKQQPDSALAALHGGDVPGYRGTAYIVFNRFPLVDFDNQIPNFSALVRRVDESGNTIDDAAQIIQLECDAAGIPSECVSLSHLGGKKLHGVAIISRAPRRQVVQDVAKWHSCGVADVGGRIVDYSLANPTIHELGEDEIEAFEWTGQESSQGDDRNAKRTRSAYNTLVSHLTLRCSNPNKSYDVTPFEHIWQSAPSYVPQSVDMLIVAPDSEAVPRSAIFHEELLLAQNSASLTIAFSHIDVAPGDVLRFPLRDANGNVETVSILVEEQTLSTNGLIQCQGRAFDAAIYTRTRPTVIDIPENPGVGISGLPKVAAFNITTFDIDWSDDPAFLVAGSVEGNESKWNGVWVRPTTQSSFSPLAKNGFKIGTRAQMGVLLDALPLGNSSTFDSDLSIQVQMFYGELSSCTEIEAQNGANLLAIGNPQQGGRWLRFLNAVETSAGVYTLSGILDGEFGSDDVLTLDAGSFVVVATNADGDDVDGLQWQEMGGNDNGHTFGFTPSANPPRGKQNRVEGVPFTFTPNERAWRPNSPVHIEAAHDTDGLRFAFDARNRNPDDSQFWARGLEPELWDRIGGQLLFDVDFSEPAIGTLRLSSSTARIETVIAAIGAGVPRVAGVVRQIGQHGNSPDRAFDISLS